VEGRDQIEKNPKKKTDSPISEKRGEGGQRDLRGESESPGLMAFRDGDGRQEDDYWHGSGGPGGNFWALGLWVHKL